MSGRLQAGLLVLVAVAGVLAALLALALWIAGARAGPWIERTASDALGRQVAIRGETRVEWGLRPEVVLRDIRVANPEWASADAFLTADRLAGRVDPVALLSGQTRLEAVDGTGVRLNLERGGNGRANWQQGDQGSGSGALPVIDGLELRGVTVHYRGPSRDPGLTLRLDRLRGSLTGAARRLRGRAGGTWGERGELHVRMDTELAATKRRPLELEVRLGEHRGSFSGSADAGSWWDGMRGELSAAGPDLAGILPAGWRDAANWPAYEARGAISRRQGTWQAQSLELNLGESDAAGHLALTTSGERYALSGELESGKLDLVQLLGGRGGGGPVRPAALKGLDVELAWSVGTLYTPPLTLEDVQLDASLQRGRLAVQPLRFALAGGSGTVQLVVDAGGAPPRADLQLSVEAVDLRKALARLDVEREGFGHVDGNFALEGRGESVDAMLGAANGELAVVMRDGSIDRALVEAAIANLPSLVSSRGEGEGVVPLRCTIADARIEGGVARFTRLLVDTEDARVVGDGTIALDDLALDLRLLPRNKDFSLISGQPPVHVTGTLLDPAFAVDEAAAVASLLTPIELGVARDADCAALAEAARSGLEFRE